MRGGQGTPWDSYRSDGSGATLRSDGSGATHRVAGRSLLQGWTGSTEAACLLDLTCTRGHLERWGNFRPRDANAESGCSLPEEL